MHAPQRACAVVFALAALNGVASAETQEDRAHTRALQLARAFQELDAETVVKLTLPDLTWSAGGDAKLLQIMSKQFSDARRAGVVVDSVTLGQQTPTGDDGTTRYIFFPYTILSHSDKVKIIDKAFYLAISDDSGRTWYFVDGLRLTDAVIKKAFVRGYDGNPPLPKREHQEERQ